MARVLTDWQKIYSRHEDLSNELVSPALENSKRHVLQKEFSYISTLISRHQELERLSKSLESSKEQLKDVQDAELKGMFEEEIKDFESQVKAKEDEIEDLLFPPDPLDERSIFLEIRAGTGGQEAALFASDLLRMYTNYALKKGWKVAVASSSTTDLGGFKEIILHIEGKGVYGKLKKESGVHRVQRVPKTETSGRIHTSTATVAVLPEAEEVDLTINPSDLRIDVYRASGAGGQHVNTTDSAVRITHIPTGVVVACQDERSQHKNKAKAMKMLQSRLLSAQKEKQDTEISQKRKEQIGTGERSEKVRTYNFPQNRISDHQIELTLNKLDMILEGYLDEIVDALQEHSKQERLNRPIVNK